MGGAGSYAGLSSAAMILRGRPLSYGNGLVRQDVGGLVDRPARTTSDQASPSGPESQLSLIL